MKRYARHLCVYCQERRSIPTGDHIFARGFFSEDRRGNLPKAPGCMECNGRKSQLETYLTAVLPFGGVHPDSTRDLDAVEARLAKNLRLKNQLRDGMANVGDDLTVPFDGSKLQRYFEMVTTGLLWHHGRRYLPKDYGTVVVTPLESARDAIAPLLHLRGDTVEGNLGSSTFVYKGVTANDDPAVTVWEYLIMGGLRMAESSVEDTMNRVIAFTTTKSSIARITGALALEPAG